MECCFGFQVVLQPVCLPVQNNPAPSCLADNTGTVYALCMHCGTVGPLNEGK